MEQPLRLTYRASKEHWNRLFSALPLPNPVDPLPSPVLEDAIGWLSKESSSVIDFGCGTGKSLLRSLVLGAKRGIGIDFSRAAVSMGRSMALKCGLQDRATFICGDVSELSKFSRNHFDSGILFNILDNLIPDDGQAVLKEFHRLIKSGGRVLLKLNQFVEESELTRDYGAKLVFGRLYVEPTGLYFWDLDNHSVRQLVDPWFKIERTKRIHLGKTNQFNRLYYLRKL